MRKGVTLFELLLVLAIGIMVAPLGISALKTKDFSSQDKGIKDLVRNSISNAYSMGLIGRKDEARLYFEKDKGDFIVGNNTVQLLPGYTVTGVKGTPITGDVEDISFPVELNFSSNGVAYVGETESKNFKKIDVNIKRESENLIISFNLPVIYTDSDKKEGSLPNAQNKFVKSSVREKFEERYKTNFSPVKGL